MEESVKRKTWLIIFFIFSVFLLTGHANAGVIFQDNFDAQNDWTLPQPINAPSTCWVNCTVPSGWNHYYNGRSFCPGGPGKNNMYIDNVNSRGGSGKGMTFWDESCVDFVEDSDGQLGKFLGADYQEVYVRFYIKFSPTYQWKEGEFTPFHKFIHIWSYGGSGEPYNFFDRNNNEPVFVGNFEKYLSNISTMLAFRCEVNYYCQGTPRYTFMVGTDMDHTVMSTWAALRNGQWHSVEYNVKMNTYNAGLNTFNADGVARFWLDGNLIYSVSNIPWKDNGGTPNRGFNSISIGGNNYNRWTTSCSGTSCEQWYAVDDVVVSTTYIGPGGTVADTTPPNPPSGFFVD